MDEILFSNFTVFHDLVREEPYDLWIGDEAWELDYYLHENPEQKQAAYVWLTDFVGWLPMPDGGEREAFLTADYNAEMIEHIARYGRVRDRALFVGNPDDIVPARFGADLPAIRDWTEDHFDFAYELEEVARFRLDDVPTNCCIYNYTINYKSAFKFFFKSGSYRYTVKYNINCYTCQYLLF
jgi:hypothetical protein